MELGAIAVSTDSLAVDEPLLPAAGRGFMSRAAALVPHDPRILQIAFLGVLLAAGACLRDFSLRPAQIALTFAAALGIQRLLDRFTRKPAPSLLSATITALSLTLLLRADNLWMLPAAAVFAIASKFMLRVRGKHLFNPATFGVGAALLVLPGTWISPGQWGSDVALAGWLVVLGATVASRARRADISWMFLVFYLGALAMRVAWLGQRWAVWTHQLSSGALLLFAFFMISDPRTTPSHVKGRAAHAAMVAAIAYAWGFGLFRTNAVLWALFVAAPMVAVWDWLWPAPKFDWTSVQGSINGQGGINGIANIDIEGMGIENIRKPAEAPTGEESSIAEAGARRVDGGDIGVVAAGASASVLRLLRGPRRCAALQSRLPGGDGARWRSHRAEPDERLPGRAEGVRTGDTGAGGFATGPDSYR